MPPTDLNNITAETVEAATRPYRYALNHRNYIVEGIRQVAMRNLNHFTDAVGRNRQNYQVEDHFDAWISRVQSVMLADQGIEDNSINRAFLTVATFTPVQLFCALLYAEIEFFEKASEELLIYQDARYRECLDQHRDVIAHLKGFRDSFLHPRSRSPSDEQQFLAILPTTYAVIIPRLQKEFDEYLHRVGARLLQAYPAAELKTQWLNSFLQPGSRQTPMLAHLMLTVPDGHERSLPLDRRNRHERHIIQNAAYYERLIVCALVLWSEGLRAIKHALDRSEHDSEAEREGSREDPLQTIMAVPSSRRRLGDKIPLVRVATALAHAPLEMYQKVARENTAIGSELIDQYLSVPSRLKALRNHRRVVFHIKQRERHPGWDDILYADSELGTAVVRVRHLIELRSFYIRAKRLA